METLITYQYLKGFPLVKKNYKYFIGYLYDDYKVKPLHIMLPKTSKYVKSCEGKTKSMYFLIQDDDLLKKYNNIQDKVSADIKKECDRKPIYNKNYFGNHNKTYSDEATDFHDKEIPETGSNHICLAAITIDSALKKDDNYYSQVFLK